MNTKSSKHSLFLNWIVGFLFSFLFIWSVSYFFSDTHIIYTWNREIKNYVYAPIIVKHRSEGWGISHIGKYGISGIPDITKVTDPKAAIWGDSHLEALEVNDKDKIPQLITQLCISNKIDMCFFGIGNSGDDCADYYFGIPKLEAIVPKILIHYILIHDLDDTLPDKSDSRCLFLSQPKLRFVEKKRKLPYPEYQNIRKFIYKYKLDFLMGPVQTLLYDTKLRFAIGPIATPSLKEIINLENTSKKNNDSWSFLLKKFKQQTKRPIVFVYFPTIPNIKGTINYDDSDISLKNGFMKACLKQNIDFIDMTSEFIDYYKNNYKFPRGFINSNISEGHLNSVGHKLIAKKIYQHFLKKRI